MYNSVSTQQLTSEPLSTVFIILAVIYLCMNGPVCLCIIVIIFIHTKCLHLNQFVVMVYVQTLLNRNLI